MTNFVHLEYSNQHPGVARVESAISSALQIKRSLSGTRGLATLLLSAIAAAVIVAAYQLMDSMAEGQLLVLWIGMWVVAFATLAALAGSARLAAKSLKASLDGWSRRLASQRADERLWAMARTDARVMADLQWAVSRGEALDPRDEGLKFVPPATTVSAAKPKSAATGTTLTRAYQQRYI
jgi:hypothetical protein